MSFYSFSAAAFKYSNILFRDGKLTDKFVKRAIRKSTAQ